MRAPHLERQLRGEMTHHHTLTTEDHLVIFTDIHNYSIVSKAMGDQAGFLQEVYECLGDIIVEHRGEIIKYMGDGMLCIFPEGSENQTVACAFALRKAYATVRDRRNIEVETELEIGISSGEIQVGIFGHPSLRQKDIFGEPVMRAAMIGHHRGIAISENVHEKIKADYRTQPLPDLKLKWQETPLRVWEVMEAK
ncbi:MAG: adenylate/guanylate cyclase domain-containing protein [Desulfobacterales bacterium]